MSWAVRAVPLPDGERPVDLWVDAGGCLVDEPVPDSERLPGRYVVPGLVDAHAHPAVGWEAGMPVALDGSETLNVLAAWAASGVCLVRDTGSAGGSVLHLDLVPGLPRLQAAGRFLAPAGRYFPALLPEAAPQRRLTELAMGELARGGQWVKVIADFPPVAGGVPSGPPELTYPGEAIEAMIAAVHAAGGRVAAHATTDVVSALVRAGVDSIEHGTAIDEPALRLMAQTGAAWTPTLCAVLGLPDTAPEAARGRVAEHRQRLPELLRLAQRLGVPVLAGTDTAGTIAREVALLAEHGLEPAAALKAATTTAYRFLGEPFDQAGRPATLVTYQDDPREDLAILSSPRAIIIDGVRVR
jgi:imidazolonepropionase-like amidohydrolase